MAQLLGQDIKTWPKADNTPRKNGNQCLPEMEQLIVYLVNKEFDASYNSTARQAAMITGQPVSASLVRNVRKRNGLRKPVCSPASERSIRTSYDHVVSLDTLRESGRKIFGFIRDKSKLVYHHQADRQTSREALEGLLKYIEQYGRPDAVRTDHGSEFRGDFEAYLDEKKIAHVQPLPYNPKANGFIERYFRTLRTDMLRKLKHKGMKITQDILDDIAFLWNHCRQVKTEQGKTPAELAGVPFQAERAERFEVKREKIADWTFWHITGLNGIMHAYLREKMLPKGAFC